MTRETLHVLEIWQSSARACVFHIHTYTQNVHIVRTHAPQSHSFINRPAGIALYIFARFVCSRHFRVLSQEPARML